MWKLFNESFNTYLHAALNKIWRIRFLYFLFSLFLFCLSFSLSIAILYPLITYAKIELNATVIAICRLRKARLDPDSCFFKIFSSILCPFKIWKYLSDWNVSSPIKNYLRKPRLLHWNSSYNKPEFRPFTLEFYGHIFASRLSAIIIKSKHPRRSGATFHEQEMDLMIAPLGYQ